MRLEPPGIDIPPSLCLRGEERAEWVRKNELRFTWLYAIQVGEDGPIKIGVSDNPDERREYMQVGNCQKLRGLAAWRTVPEDERWLHRVLRPAWIRGEWFESHPWLVDWLRRQGGDFPWRERAEYLDGLWWDRNWWEEAPR